MSQNSWPFLLKFILLVIQFTKTDRFPFAPALVGLLLFFSGLLISATPLAYIYVYFRQGPKRFWQAAILSFVIVAAFYLLGLNFFQNVNADYPNSQWLMALPGLTLLEYFSPILVSFFGIGYFVFYLAIAVAIAFLLANPDRIFVKSLRSLLLIFLVLSALFAIFILPRSEAFFEAYHKSTSTLIGQMIQDIDQASNIDSVSAIYAKTALQKWGDNLLYFFPVMFFSSMSFIYVLNLVVAKRIFFPFRPELLLVDLTSFKMPFSFVWAFLLSLTLLLINTQFLHISWIMFVCLNILLGLMILYFYQGLSVFIFTLDLKSVHGFLRLVIYFIAIYAFALSLPLFVGVGFFDSWLNIRKWLLKKHIEKNEM